MSCCGRCVKHGEPFTEENIEQMKKVAEPLHEFICKYGDPHSAIVVKQDGVQFLSGEMFAPLEVPD